MTLYLIDHKASLVEAWQQAFAEFSNVEIIQGDFFSKAADLMVSPANSFGFMDGGLDLAIRNALGDDIQHQLQHDIVEQYHGEIPVGQAHIIETHHASWPYLASAPTMRIPMLIDGTFNVYYAFRAMLLSVERYNQQNNNAIESILCPGLGAGVGGMPSSKVAGQMAVAYAQFQQTASIPPAQTILTNHKLLEQYL